VHTEEEALEETRSAVPRWLESAAAYTWRLLVVAAGLVVLGLAFSKLLLIAIPVVGGLFLTTILSPPARWLRRHGVPPLLATWIVFVAALVVLGGIGFGLAPSVSHEFTTLGHELSRGIKQTEKWLETGPLHISKTEVNNYVKKIQKSVSSNQSKLVQGAVSGVTVVAEGVGGVLLSLVLTFFFVKDGEAITAWFVTIFDQRRGADLREILRKSWLTLGGYVRGTAANGLVNAVVLALGLLVLGVPLVVPIAILTFVGAFIPLVGAIVAGVVAALVALVSKGAVAAGVVIGLTVVIHNLEGYLVGPLVLGRAVRLHPVAILLVLAVGTSLLGIVGAFVAVPITAVALGVQSHYRSARLQRPGAPGTAVGTLLRPEPGP
jgi:predicted PurR-regulated permease PerM